MPMQTTMPLWDTTDAPVTHSLRPYQRDCVANIEKYWRRGVDRLLVIMATGTGKTIVFGHLLRAATIRGEITPERPALVIAHRQELVDQARAKIHAIDSMLSVGVTMAARRAGAEDPIIVGSVQSLDGNVAERLHGRKPGLIMLDEAHHSVSSSWQRVLRDCSAFEPGVRVVGFTATPDRLDRKSLIGFAECTFQEIAYEYQLLKAIEDGVLCDITGYAVKTSTDLSDIRSTAGDYNQKALAERVGSPQRTMAVARRWNEVAGDRRTLVFCCDVAHAHMCAEIFGRYARSEVVWGAMAEEERHAVFRRFEDGDTQVMCNVDIATEGYDNPAISCVVMTRPTQSRARYSQMLGRGTRLFPGKTDLIVVDAVDLCETHSPETLASLVGLPPRIDLEGKSARAASQEFEKLAPAQRAAAMSGKIEAMHEIGSTLRNIDVLGKARTPKDLREATDNAWVMTGDGDYVLSWSKGCAKMRRDALGRYWGELGPDPQLAPNLSRAEQLLGPDMKRAFAAMDSRLAAVDPRGPQLTSRRAWWRVNRDPATDKQVGLLRALGVTGDMSRLTKGAASDLISKMKALK